MDIQAVLEMYKNMKRRRIEKEEILRRLDMPLNEAVEINDHRLENKTTPLICVHDHELNESDIDIVGMDRSVTISDEPQQIIGQKDILAEEQKNLISQPGDCDIAESMNKNKNTTPSKSKRKSRQINAYLDEEDDYMDNDINEQPINSATSDQNTSPSKRARLNSYNNNYPNIDEDSLQQTVASLEMYGNEINARQRFNDDNNNDNTNTNNKKQLKDEDDDYMDVHETPKKKHQLNPLQTINTNNKILPWSCGQRVKNLRKLTDVEREGIKNGKIRVKLQKNKTKYDIFFDDENDTMSGHASSRSMDVDSYSSNVSRRSKSRTASHRKFLAKHLKVIRLCKAGRKALTNRQRGQKLTNRRDWIYWKAKYLKDIDDNKNNKKK